MKIYVKISKMLNIKEPRRLTAFILVYLKTRENFEQDSVFKKT